MRIDSSAWAIENLAEERLPVYVVEIRYTTSSPYFTSHAGIQNLPTANVATGSVKRISSISQQVYPDEGRTTIGSITIELTDNSSPTFFTENTQDQLLNNSEGLRNREVRIHVGWASSPQGTSPETYAPDFDDFVRVATTYINDVRYKDGVYRLTCSDKTRQLREKILEPKTTRLAASITESQNTIQCQDQLGTVGFQTIYHHAGFAETPSDTVGYCRIKETGEIFRYTTINGDTFEGVTRGVFNTRPEAIDIDTDSSTDQYPEVIEHIYLEGPGVWCAIALMTGILDVTASPMPMLPDHWHLGMSWADDFDQGQWLNIGEDLWDSTDLTSGFPVRFTHMEQEDGKAFVESQLMRLMGLFMPVNVNGDIGLKRINRIISQSAWVSIVGANQIVSYGDLQHDQGAVTNQWRINYNYDGEDLTRAVLITDTESVNLHGTAPLKEVDFYGLHTSKHTQRIVRERMAVFRDRYADPPLRLQLKLIPSLNVLEIGDVLLVTGVGNSVFIKDYTRDTADDGLARALEVQRISIDWISGAVTVDLLGSARDVPSITNNPDLNAVLATAWYTGTGSDLDAEAFITGGATTGNGTLTGHATNINNAAAIWYHDGDLEISAGHVLTINNNVQLRVKGTLTVNGTIDGAGNGRSGSADTDTVGLASSGGYFAGSKGFVGVSHATDGVELVANDLPKNISVPIEEGRSASGAYYPTLTTDDNGNLTSVFPKDIRGGGGASGGQVKLSASRGGTVLAKGGTGGDGGAGLVIVCRGLAFGPSGQINLDGTDGTAGGVTVGTYSPIRTPIGSLKYQAGTGGAGTPGTCYAVLDGDGITVPDFASGASGLTGNADPVGTNAAPWLFGFEGTARVTFLSWPSVTASSPLPTLCGLNDAAQLISDVTLTGAAFRYLYVPATGDANEEVLKPPSNLSASGNVGYVDLSWRNNGRDHDYIEIYAGTSTDVALATEVGQVKSNHFRHQLPNGGMRYYWIRKKKSGRISAFHPAVTSPLTLVTGTAQDAGLEFVLSANPNRTWNGDATGTPITWNPTNTTTDLAAEVLQFGTVIASERIRVTLDATAGTLTWSYLNNDANITTVATATPANTIDFVFTHTPTGITATDEIIALKSGESGKEGALNLTLKKNYRTYSTADDGWMYAHGFTTAGAASDVDGKITYDGSVITLEKGGIRSNCYTREGWLVFDSTLGGAFALAAPSHNDNWGACKKVNGQWWQATAQDQWTKFTPAAGMIAVGAYASETWNGSDWAIEDAQILGNGLALSSVPSLTIPGGDELLADPQMENPDVWTTTAGTTPSWQRQGGPNDKPFFRFTAYGEIRPDRRRGPSYDYEVAAQRDAFKIDFVFKRAGGTTATLTAILEQSLNNESSSVDASLAVNVSSYEAGIWHRVSLFTSRLGDALTGTSPDSTPHYWRFGLAATVSGASPRVEIASFRVTPFESQVAYGLPSYASNAAAIAGGLAAGDMYRTSDGASPESFLIKVVV